MNSSDTQKPEVDSIESLLERLIPIHVENKDYVKLNKLETRKEATSLLQDIIVKEVLSELKSIWNETQPDIVPSGWTPETLEAKVIEKRIKELQSKLKESSND